ncbi:hypothetical protein, partial [Shewanella sp.]|uniref:hypothetical protein n=1 Tax=Shewanella sp. TaxID=50422 RepID=UPI00257E0E6E
MTYRSPCPQAEKGDEDGRNQRQESLLGNSLLPCQPAFSSWSFIHPALFVFYISKALSGNPKGDGA